MRVPLSWLKQYVDILLPTPDLADRLTLAGLEVGGVEQVGDWWDSDTLRVGQVLQVLPHPDADRLVLVDVDFVGDAPDRVVTGAPNLYAYKEVDELPTIKVAFARSGAMLVDAYSDKTPRPLKKLKPSKIRGVPSSGMVCSERELGLSEEHDGILILPDDAPVGMPLRDYLGEEVLDIELTPDMARCLSMVGVAREVAALTDAPLHLPADALTGEGPDHAADYATVTIDDPALCNRYTGIIIKDVTIGPSPKWMQDSLSRAGMRPINNVVDITNFVMLEWGQPLHAFDYDILQRRAGSGKPGIVVRRAAPGEQFTTLDDVTRELDDSMLMICDSAGSVAIAGVMGGQESEVGDTTTNILLESATFEGINNRRTAQKLRLPSEASYRFARGVPATLNPIAARRAAELMREYAGGRIVPGMIDTYPVLQTEQPVYTTVSDMRRILGMPVTQDEIIDSLRRLDFTVGTTDTPAADAGPNATFALRRVDDETLIECMPPWHRLDVTMPADLTEEVARVIGYEHVGTTLLDTELPTQHRNAALDTERKLRSVLVAVGLQETINHPLSTPENHDKLQPGGTPSTEVDYIVLANPIAPERGAMRRTMLVSALENLARNIRFTDRLLTFEVGRVYLPEAGDGTLPKEERRVSLLMTGPRTVEDFYHSAHAAAEDNEMDFFDLKGVVEGLLDRLGFKVAEIDFRAKPDSGTFGPRCAELYHKEQYLGIMGELHPQVRSAFGVSSSRVCAAELAITPLIKPHWSLDPMPPISNYPPVVEDLAFEVSEGITARQVEAAIAGAGGDLLVNVELFDIYRGDPIAPGHKSLAYNLTYQSPERSLSDKDVARLRKRIVGTVEHTIGGKLRQ